MLRYNIGALTAVTILAELGDAGRLSSLCEAGCYAGHRVTVHQPDTPRARPPAPEGPLGLNSVEAGVSDVAELAPAPDDERASSPASARYRVGSGASVWVRTLA